MVESSLGQSGLLTNRIHRRAPVASCQEQFLGRRQDSLLRLRNHHAKTNVPTSRYSQVEIESCKIVEILGALEVMADVEPRHPRGCTSGGSSWQPGALFTAVRFSRAATQ